MRQRPVAGGLFYCVLPPYFALWRLQIPPKTTSQNNPVQTMKKPHLHAWRYGFLFLYFLMIRQLPLGPMDIVRSAVSIPVCTVRERRWWSFLRFAGGGGPFPAPEHPMRPEPRTAPSRAELPRRGTQYPFPASPHRARRRPPPRAPPATRGSSDGSYPPWHGRQSTARQPTEHPHWQTSRQRYAAGNGN